MACVSWLASRIFFAGLVLALPGVATAQVSWNSDVNGTWHSGANWTPTSPSALDDVVIDQFNKNVTVTHSSGATTVNSLTLKENLDITGGSIAVSNGLDIGDNYRVKVTTFGSSFSAAGAISFNGSALYAGSGTSISLPTATGYVANSAPPFPSAHHVHADGGSIDLSGLTIFLGTGGSFARADAMASNGGSIDLSSLGNLYGGSVQLMADGVSSQLDASSIGEIKAGSIFGVTSKLQATNGGTLVMNGITELDRVSIVSDGTGTMATAQLEAFTRGAAQISGGAPDFSGMTNIDGASFVVSGGATVRVPSAFAWSDPSPDSFATRSFTANGTGSLLDLSTLTTIAPTTSTNPPLVVQATAGGTTDISAIPAIIQGVVQVDATGAGSVVDLGNLRQLRATYKFGGSRAHLKATAGGSILVGKLATLDQVDLYIDGTGTMATAQIKDFNNGTAFVSGAGTQPTFGAMTDIDGASFQVSGGAKVSVPATSYIDLANTAFPLKRFKATGAGSEFDASSITTFRTSDESFAETYVEAYSGGRVDLSGVAEPYPGTGTIKFVADGTAGGTPSEVDISGLTTFKVTPQFAKHSSIAATNGGKVNMPNLTALEFVHLQNDGTGQMQIGQIQEFARGTVTMSGGTHEFTNLTNIDGASFVATGGAVITAPVVNHYDDTASGAFSDRLVRASGNGSRIDLSNLTDLDTTPAAFTLLKIEALAGGFVDLSGLVTFDTGAVQILADGTNGTGTPSIIDLSSLATFNPVAVFGESSGITVTNGGELRLGFVPMPGLDLKVSSGGRIVVDAYELSNGAVLSGNGIFTGDLSNNSTVSPGNSPDTLVIDGGYTQGNDGTLLIELQGTDAGEFDILQISGGAILDGTLDVDLLGGFTPVFGQSFEFLTAANGVTGQFDDVLLPSLGEGNFWQVSYGTHSVAITAVPEPSSVVLVIGAGLIGGFVRYRRCRGANRSLVARERLTNGLVDDEPQSTT